MFRYFSSSSGSKDNILSKAALGYPCVTAVLTFPAGCLLTVYVLLLSVKAMWLAR